MCKIVLRVFNAVNPRFILFFIILFLMKTRDFQIYCHWKLSIKVDDELHVQLQCIVEVRSHYLLGLFAVIMLN